MKKLAIVLIVFCLCFPGVAGAEEACKYGEGDLILGEVTVEKATGQPANGVECTYYEGGKLIVPFKNGKEEGISRHYYESGKLKEESPFKNGKEEGIVRFYYESGELKEESPFKDGKLEGIVRFYYESGKLESEHPYKNDKEEGYRSIYEESGELWGKILYRNDEAVSGACADGRAFTDEELISWESGQAVICD